MQTGCTLCAGKQKPSTNQNCIITIMELQNVDLYDYSFVQKFTCKTFTLHMYCMRRVLKQINLVISLYSSHDVYMMFCTSDENVDKNF